MRRTVSAFLGVLVLLAWGEGVRQVTVPVGAERGMPPEPSKIEASLIARGAIPATADPASREQAVRAYILSKMAGNRGNEGNPLARKTLDAREEALNLGDTAALRGRKFGDTIPVTPSSPAFKPLQSTGRLLVILVDFSETPYTWTPSGQPARTAAGPLHNRIPVPGNSFDLWVQDFSPSHYANMIFAPGGWTFPAGTPRYAGERRGSMRDYLLQQSYGKYGITGQAYGWFTVARPEAYYGDDAPTGGVDNLGPGTPTTLVGDAVDVANAKGDIDWLQYDREDPYDFDGDLDLNEPDCIIDHPLFIHAGIDQSGGGGAQGDDALWAYSRTMTKWVTTAKNPGATCPASWPGTRIYNYTIMPEDGGIGVFAHEFGHDLGLPDEYDTVYSGGNSTAYWSLMSGGSWIGRPAQTQPSPMSIWGRYSLGWLGDALGVTSLEGLRTAKQVRLEQAERWGGPSTFNAIRVALPEKRVVVNQPHGGSYEWFGGRGDEIDTRLTRVVDLAGKTSAALSFWTWYDIEEWWDFGFVQVSADGATWTSLPIAGTTDVMDPAGYPAIAENLPGFTGSSGGWVHKTIDLSPYAGHAVLLRFRYMTDWGTSRPGFYVDDMQVTADGATIVFDAAEAPDGAWTADGWTRDQGFVPYTHYYMLEWRNLADMETPFDGTTIPNFDAGLRNAFAYDPWRTNPTEPYYYSYSPGLLLWYRDTSYSDNWTGEHPGGGFLLVVDAHNQPIMAAPRFAYGSAPWNYLVQSYDAPFSLTPAPALHLGAWGRERDYNGFSGVPSFDDGQRYWSPLTATSSVITPRYGLMFRVLGEASDGSAAAIGLGWKPR